MARTAPDSGATDYGRPAGGWGAARAVGRFLLHSKAPLKSMRALLEVNQTDGFDCPGCAWPDPADASLMEFCENGVKAVAAETTGKRVTREFFARHSVAELLKQSDFWLEDQGRLTEPMRYNADTDHYVPVSWDDAFARIGSVLNDLSSPNEAVFYTSGRTSNEAAFLYQLFGRILGTNNFPDCSNMCHESSGVGLTESIGVGKGTVTLDDFAVADAIFILGQNPGTNHPRMLAVLQAARERGADVVSINPLIEPGLTSFLHPKKIGAMLTATHSDITSLYLQVKIGGDLAALKGIMKCILVAEERAPGSVLDHDFIRNHTSGFDAFAEDLRRSDWALIERESSLTQDDLQKAADIYIRSGAVICCWAMGLTQHRHAVTTIQAISNLLLLRGNLGRLGAGACPVRGHSNVQGDRTVGITEKPPPALLEGLERTFGFTPPAEHGLDTVGAINAMAHEQVSAFFSLGGNFVRATPDSNFTENALRRCGLTAHVATKLNRSHLVHGREAYILPCLGRTERDEQAGGIQSVTVEDSMSMVHASVGRRQPASDHLLSEPAIVARLANATVGSDILDWDNVIEDYGRIRDLIERTLPAFVGYNGRILEPGGFHLRNTAREREWETATQKARFIVHDIPDRSLPDGMLWLTTIRSHDQYNTTIYGMQDRYRGVHGTRHVVFMNHDDRLDLGVDADEIVDLVSHHDDGIERRAVGFRVVDYNIPRGCAAAYFPETNVLVSVNSYADGSRTPTSKSIPIRIEKR